MSEKPKKRTFRFLVGGKRIVAVKAVSSYAAKLKLQEKMKDPANGLGWNSSYTLLPPRTSKADLRKGLVVV